jgi:hypothetical protein
VTVPLTSQIIFPLGAREGGGGASTWRSSPGRPNQEWTSNIFLQDSSFFVGFLNIECHIINVHFLKRKQLVIEIEVDFQ